MGVREPSRQIRARSGSKRRRTERQPRLGRMRAARRFLTRFLRLHPISPLSTGLLPNILLPRLGSRVHGAHVIGTEVPASPEGRQRQEGAAGDGRTDLRRLAMRRAIGVFACAVYVRPRTEWSY